MSVSYQPDDDYCHLDYPGELQRLWKENYYFNFIDVENGAWGMNHISLERKTNKGRFRALHIVDDEVLFHENTIDIPDRAECLSDGLLSIHIIEPFKKYLLVFNGPKHRAELTFEARFPVRDYEGRNKGNTEAEKAAIKHYEQAMTVSGCITRDNQSRMLSCFGHRDHSWGYRDESDIKGWRWVAINFDKYNIGFVKVFVTEKLTIDAGFISDREKSSAVKKVNILSTQYDQDGAPIAPTIRLKILQEEYWT